MRALSRGAFVAVVGASGVGKDALMSYAREHAPAGVHFPRRVITRAPGAGEGFDPIDEARFADAAAAGAFAVWWRAHGLGYGIPSCVDERVRDGHVVVVNVSRAVLGELAARYRHLLVARITVSDEVRAQRLHRRGREQLDDIRERLARRDPSPDFPVDAEIRNDGTLAEGGEQLLRVIRRAVELVR